MKKTKYNNKVLQVKMPEILHTAAHSAAAANGTTISEVVRHNLASYANRQA